MLLQLEKNSFVFYGIVLVFYFLMFRRQSLASRLKVHFFTLASLVFFVTILRLSIGQTVLLIVLVGLFYGFSFFSNKLFWGSYNWIFPFVVIAMLGFFSNKVIKLIFVEPEYSFLHIIGISYMMLKIIQFLIDDYFGLIKTKNFGSFLSFILFFPVYISGPIPTYQEFQNEVGKTNDLYAHLALSLEGIKRVIIGMFKLVVLSKFTTIYSFFYVKEDILLNAPFYQLLLFMYAAYIDLYFNFSGYCDVAIGISKLFGITVVENFNYPFLARNFQELWMKWHFSFSRWLKSYLFLPLYKKLSSTWFGRYRTFSVAGTLLTTFFAMGIFQGLGFNYIFHGTALACGVLATVYWSVMLKKLGLHQVYMKNRLIKGGAIFITNTYFAFCILFFDANTPERLKILKQLLRRFTEGLL